MQFREDGTLRLTIGEMTRLSCTTKDTLYFYEKKGLITPKEVDPETGYRYYDVENFYLMDMIRALREAESSVEEVRSWLDQPSPEFHIHLLKEKMDYLDRRIADITELRERIAGSVAQTQLGLQARQGEITIQEEPEAWLIARPSIDQNDPSKYLPAFFEVLKICSENHIPFDYHVSAMLSQQRLNAGNFDADYFYARSVRPVQDEYVSIRPAGTYISTVHFGPYRTLEASYRLLLEHIEHGGWEICGNAYEETLVGWMNSSAEDAYRTRLSIQIKKEEL